jgi:pimeloyl-ACP methyl ester carboxylesterase
MTYVLIHGAWHANWCWEKVVPLIEKKGHRVLAPNLPGHGKASIIKNITLKTYVDKIISLIEREEKQVILVGHSMAGVVITQVASNIPEQINTLIYISGFVPKHRGALVHEESKNSSVSKEIFIDPENNEISLKLSDKIKHIFYNNCTEKDYRWALSNLQKQALRPFIDTINISEERFGKVSKIYIECLKDEAIKIEDQRRMHAKLTCDIVSLETDHSPFISSPVELVEALTRFQDT